MLNTRVPYLTRHVSIACMGSETDALLLTKTTEVARLSA